MLEPISYFFLSIFYLLLRVINDQIKQRNSRFYVLLRVTNAYIKQRNVLLGLLKLSLSIL